MIHLTQRHVLLATDNANSEMHRKVLLAVANYHTGYVQHTMKCQWWTWNWTWSELQISFYVFLVRCVGQSWLPLLFF